MPLLARMILTETGFPFFLPGLLSDFLSDPFFCLLNQRYTVVRVNFSLLAASMIEYHFPSLPGNSLGIFFPPLTSHENNMVYEKSKLLQTSHNNLHRQWEREDHRGGGARCTRGGRR